MVYRLDVPELFAKYKPSLGILPLAEACFLNKALNVHSVTTQFFHLLGYQGQLLDYYKSDTRFNITQKLLTDATISLRKEALELQGYFFRYLSERSTIEKPLLQHYLLQHFFKVIYKKYPDRIEALKNDAYLSNDITFDYVALPNKLGCEAYLPTDYQVVIEYANPSKDIAKIACVAIQCSQASYKNWQSSLNLQIPSYKSNYIFRFGDSYEKYNFTYIYGLSPRAGGFYLAGDLKNDVVEGIAYSYFGDNHQFIAVSRHEAIHHDNFILYLAALKSNRNITAFTNRNFNEGLAVLFSEGACASSYVNQKFQNTSAPHLPTLLNNEYIGYGPSWLYNNYLIQEHPDFYRDMLTLNKDDFKARWSAILVSNQQHFFNWLADLKQTCQGAPKELSTENCPSIYLKDCSSIAATKPIATTVRVSRNTKSTPGFLTAKNLTPDEMGRELIFKISRGDFAGFQQLLKDGANVNYCEDPQKGDTLLHFLYYYNNCDTQYLELLLNHGAKVTVNAQGLFPFDRAKEKCNSTQLQAIKDTFARFSSDNLHVNTSKPEAIGLVPYQQKIVAITVSIPIASLSSGVIGAVWDEVGQRHKQQYPYLPDVIHYGLKPVSLALGSAGMNSLLAGSASSIGLEEDAWLSFAYYLGMNYFGLMIAQLGERATQKIQNKLIKILLPVLLYTFFLNPSLLIELLSEGLTSGTLPMLMMPLLNMLSSGMFFKAGEYGTQKIIGKFFPENAAMNDTNRTYIAYKLSESIEDSKENPMWDDKLIEFKKSFASLQKLFEPVLKTSAHQLIFSKNLELLEKIYKLETIEEINSNLNDFNHAVDALKKIKDDLSKLDKIPNKKNILREIINKVIPTMNAIRPSQQVFHANGLVVNNKNCMTLAEEQRIPLTSFTSRVTPRYTRTPTSRLGRISSIFKSKADFPDPPTEQELQSMGITNQV
jgi:predicted DNA-binding protein